MDDAPSPYETGIVRVFPDYADTVIWFSSPIPYPETGLSPELISRLTAWEASYYASLTADFTWNPLADLHTFNATGLELARAVSDELGPTFTVEYRSFETPDAVTTLRPDHASTNPTAEAAFTTLADRARRNWASLRAGRTDASGAPVKLHARNTNGDVFPLD